MRIYQTKENHNAIKFCQEFLHKEAKRYLFGTNDYAVSIAKALDNNIEGYINNLTQETHFNGKPIINFKALPKDALVVSCVVLSRGLEIREKLDSLGLRNLDYFAFYKYSGLDIKSIDFVNFKPNGKPYNLIDAKKDIESNLEAYKEIFDILSDSQSKSEFEQCVNFRLHCDLDILRGLKYTPDTQYFEDFIDFDDIDYFFDIGGFEGESSLEFIRHNPRYKHIFFFEPESKNFNKAIRNLSSYKQILFNSFGLGGQEKEVCISQDNGSANKISQSGEKIKIKRLDSLLEKFEINGGGVL